MRICMLLVPRTQEKTTRFPPSRFSCDLSEHKEMQEGSRGEGEEGKSFGLALGKLPQ